METIEIDGKQYKVSGHAADGLPIIKATATSTHHGFDKDGNPKISVHVQVPPITIGATPGEAK